MEAKDKRKEQIDEMIYQVINYINEAYEDDEEVDNRLMEASASFLTASLDIYNDNWKTELRIKSASLYYKICETVPKVKAELHDYRVIKRNKK